MKIYNLIIDSKEKETERYRYFISAEEIIKKPELLVNSGKIKVNIVIKFFLKYFSFLFRFSTNPFLKQISKKNKFMKSSVKNPYIFARYAIANTNDNFQAMKSARKASLIYRNFSLKKRLEIAKILVKEVSEKHKNLIEILIAEGHSLDLANLELDYLLENVLAEENLEFLSKNLLPIEYSKKDKFIYRPYGVFGIITPYNGPLIAASITIISSIISGNTCIVKPSSDFPLSNLELVKIFNKVLEKNKLPRGLINIIVGNSKEIVTEWVNSDEVDGIAFFGASHHGIDIATQCLNKNKKIILELSGSDATLVWKDADLEKACDDIIKSRFIASGQFCYAIKRAFIHNEVYREVKDLLLRKIKRLKIGLPSTPGIDQVPIGNYEIIETLKKFILDAKKKGAKIISGGNFVDYNCVPCDFGPFLEPTIITEVKNNMELMKEEVFGPILPLVEVNNNIDEVIELINNTKFGLRASLWSNNSLIIEKFINNINVGSIIINTSHYYMGKYSAHLGGIKASGIGGAKYFTEEMCYKKYIHIN